MIELAIPLTVALAMLAFFWGLTKYIFSKGGDGKIEAKNVMIYGLVALFVMFSVWAIISFFQRDLGLQDGGLIQIKEI